MLYSCNFYHKKDVQTQGHCIFVDLREENKVNQTFLISTLNDTSYYYLYDYENRFDYTSDFNNETTYVIPKQGLSHYIINTGLFIDIIGGTIICKVNSSTFLSIKKEILITKNSIHFSGNISNYYGVGLFDTQDSLFYTFHNKSETIIFLKKVNEILQKNRYQNISKHLLDEIINKVDYVQ
jgi:hypothetical protein